MLSTGFSSIIFLDKLMIKLLNIDGECDLFLYQVRTDELFCYYQLEHPKQT